MDEKADTGSRRAGNEIVGPRGLGLLGVRRGPNRAAPGRMDGTARVLSGTRLRRAGGLIFYTRVHTGPVTGPPSGRSASRLERAPGRFVPAGRPVDARTGRSRRRRTPPSLRQETGRPAEARQSTDTSRANNNGPAGRFKPTGPPAVIRPRPRCIPLTRSRPNLRYLAKLQTSMRSPIEFLEILFAHAYR